MFEKSKYELAFSLRIQCKKLDIQRSYRVLLYILIVPSFGGNVVLPDLNKAMRRTLRRRADLHVQ